MGRGRLKDGRDYRVASAACALTLLAAPWLLGQPLLTHTDTVERIRTGGSLRMGFRADARPFAYRDARGKPAGYSVELCGRIAAAASRELGLAALPIEWIPLAVDTRFQTLQEGRVDLLCGADTETLARRETASFSRPIFPGGIGALLRSSAVRLREALSGRPQMARPLWRAAADRALRGGTFLIVGGTASELWLANRLKELELVAKVASVDGYDAGVQAVMERRADVFFGERAILLDAGKRYSYARDLVVLDRQFTHEPVALAMRRGDEAFRLLVDRTLSELYGSGGIVSVYEQFFGVPDEGTLTFFEWNTLR
jgi:ABC-type amino acid transport substrate-binding protein